VNTRSRCFDNFVDRIVAYILDSRIANKRHLKMATPLSFFPDLRSSFTIRSQQVDETMDASTLAQAEGPLVIAAALLQAMCVSGEPRALA